MQSPLKVILSHRPDGNPYMRLLSDSLRDEGIDVGFLGEGRFPFLRQRFESGRGRVIHLQWQHGLFLGRNRASAVIRTMSFFLQMFALKLRGVRFVWTVHNLANHEGRLAKWELRASRKLARSVDKVVVHCETAARTVAETYGIDMDRVCVVPHGHYGEAYPQPVDRVQARKDLGLAEDDTIILFFGQLRTYKGVKELIEAFGRSKTASVSLVVVGEPRPLKLGDELSAMASGDPQIVLRLEQVGDETLARFIGACDVVALPYARSLTSGASILAASLGRPIIAPRLGCMAEMPEDSAILYDSETAGGLEAALSRSFTAELDQMGRSARDHVLEYPWTHVARELRTVYTEAVENSN